MEQMQVVGVEHVSSFSVNHLGMVLLKSSKVEKQARKMMCFAGAVNCQ